MDRYYQVASVLYGVMKTVILPEKFPPKVPHLATRNTCNILFHLLHFLHIMKYDNLEQLFCSFISTLNGLKERKFHATTFYPLMFLVPHNQ